MGDIAELITDDEIKIMDEDRPYCTIERNTGAISYESGVNDWLEPKELVALNYFADRPNTLLTNEELEEGVIGSYITGLREYIKKLRQKIEPDPSNPVYLLNYNHKGYSFGEVDRKGPFGEDAHQNLFELDWNDLSPSQQAVMHYMVLHEDRKELITSQELAFNALHGQDDTNARHYVAQIREKIEPDPDNPIFIVYKWHKGYRFNSNP